MHTPRAKYYFCYFPIKYELCHYCCRHTNPQRNKANKFCKTKAYRHGPDGHNKYLQYLFAVGLKNKDDANFIEKFEISINFENIHDYTISGKWERNVAKTRKIETE